MYKTRVYKDRYGKNYWTCTYYLPYSGLLSAQYTTWEEAMKEACCIEKLRAWV